MQRQHHLTDPQDRRLSSPYRAAQLTLATVIAVLVLAGAPFDKPNEPLRHQTLMTIVVPGFLPTLEFAGTGDADAARSQPVLDTVAVDARLTLTTDNDLEVFNHSDAFAF